MLCTFKHLVYYFEALQTPSPSNLLPSSQFLLLCWFFGETCLNPLNLFVCHKSGVEKTRSRVGNIRSGVKKKNQIWGAIVRAQSSWLVRHDGVCVFKPFSPSWCCFNFEASIWSSVSVKLLPSLFEALFVWSFWVLLKLCSLALFFLSQCHFGLDLLLRLNLLLSSLIFFYQL